MEQDYYYVICPMEDRRQGMPLKKYVFGPYKDYDAALVESDKFGGGEPIPLTTNDLEIAIKILEETK